MKIWDTVKFRRPIRREFWPPSKCIVFTHYGAMVEEKNDNGDLSWTKWLPCKSDFLSDDWDIIKLEEKVGTEYRNHFNKMLEFLNRDTKHANNSE